MEPKRDAVAEEAEDGQQRVAEEAEQTSGGRGRRSTEDDAVDDGKDGTKSGRDRDRSTLTKSEQRRRRCRIKSRASRVAP